MFLHDIAKVQTIVVHGDCPDGLASAIILHDALPDVPILFLKHGTAEYENLEAKPGMLFADICPPFARVQEFIDAGSFVLDHHKTAKEYVERFGDHAHFGDEKTNPGVSGAMLCFDHVWKKIAIDDLAHRGVDPMDDLTFAFTYFFAKLAGIRDTWQRNDPDWRSACEQANVLKFMPQDRWLEVRLVDLAKSTWPLGLGRRQTWDERFGWVGKVLYEQNERSVEKAIKGARYVKTERGTRLVIFEGTTKTSDAAELLGQDADLIVGFNYFEENFNEGRRTMMILSTRSHTTYDCSKLAEFFGGGGHTKAAGFQALVKTNDTNPYDYILAAVTQYELTTGDEQ